VTTERRRSFPCSAASAGQARRFVDAVLVEADLEPLGYATTLLVSELVANAILHAATGVDVVVRPNRPGLRIEVHDGSPQLPMRKHYSAMSGTGRGLVLVQRMASRWGVEPTTTGKSVWFELDGPAELDVLDVVEVDAL